MEDSFIKSKVAAFEGMSVVHPNECRNECRWSMYGVNPMMLDFRFPPARWRAGRGNDMVTMTDMQKAGKILREEIRVGPRLYTEMETLSGVMIIGVKGDRVCAIF